MELLRAAGKAIVWTTPSRTLSRIVHFALIILLFAEMAQAANWYVDSAASGSGSGNSWANAWRNTANIDWGVVRPGDTVWLSGGASGRRYSGFTVGASGTPGNPVTIRCAQEAGRNGLVTLTNRLNLSTQIHVIVNGARSDSYQVPVAVTDLKNITNNIGIRVVADAEPCLFALNFVGSQFLWIDVAEGGSFDLVETHGIWINAYDYAVSNGVIAYCWVHDSAKDGVNIGMGAGTRVDWDNLTIHHCIIEVNVDDGIQIGGSGLTVHHNIIGVKSMQGTSGHPDMIQPSGGTHMHVYNNIFYNSWNAWYYAEMRVAEEGGPVGHLYFYGNVCYVARDWIGLNSQNYGFFAQAWRDPNKNGGTGEGPVNSAVMTNIYILNNTFYHQKAQTVMLSHSMQSFPPVQVYRAYVTNCAVKNNIVIDGHFVSQSGAPLTVKGNDGDIGMFYSETSCPLDYNIVAGANPRINYGGTIYSSGEAMAAATGLKHNYSSMPQVESTNTYDFRLKATDAVARDRGQNLTSLTNRLVGLGTDLWGNPRGQAGAWDIGANEYRAGAGGGTYTLTVASSNPGSGVSVTVSPNDSQGAGNGTTPLTRQYGDGVVATLTAPATVGGNQFVKWQLNGTDLTTNRTTTATMSASRTMTAVYVGPARTLTVASSNPGSGVSVTVTPNDSQGNGNGTTPLTRQYSDGTTVTLTAPATAGGNEFLKWQLDGSDLTTSRTASVDLSANQTVTALYVPPAAAPKTLTVNSSNPGSGVAVTVSPNDTQGSGNGTTPFNRQYTNGLSVTLTAPATAGSGTFVKWQLDGSDLTTSRTAAVALSANRALVAVYSAQTASDLLLHFDFEGEFSNGVVTDRSGNGNHGYRFGRLGTGTNWPTSVMWTNNGRLDNGANFDWYSDGYGSYSKSGDYIGVTNLTSLDTLDQATIMCWAHYDAAYTGSWTADGQATLIDGGYGYKGAWSLGRFNWTGTSTDRTLWTVYTNDGSSAYFTMNYPDLGGQDGDTAAWHHYAVTFANGVCVIYYDGSPLATNTVPDTTQLNIRPSWLAVGCKSHNASSPYLESANNSNDDEWPNHAWFNGQMDEVRIYRGILNASQIDQIYRGADNPTVTISRPRNLRVLN